MAENQADHSASVRLLDRARQARNSISRLRHSIEMSPDEERSLDIKLEELETVLREIESLLG